MLYQNNPFHYKLQHSHIRKKTMRAAPLFHHPLTNTRSYYQYVTPTTKTQISRIPGPLARPYFSNFYKNARIRENMQKRVVFPRGRFLIQAMKTSAVKEWAPLSKILLTGVDSLLT